MKPSDLYLKIVEWSDEGGCYVGRCPGFFLAVFMGTMKSRSTPNCVIGWMSGLKFINGRENSSLNRPFQNSEHFLPPDVLGEK